MSRDFETVLADARVRGISLAADGDQLRVRGPGEAIGPELRAELVAVKPALLAHLSSVPAFPEPDAPAVPPSLRTLARAYREELAHWPVARRARYEARSAKIEREHGTSRVMAQLLAVEDIYVAEVFPSRGPLAVSAHHGEPRRQEVAA